MKFFLAILLVAIHVIAAPEKRLMKKYSGALQPADTEYGSTGEVITGTNVHGYGNRALSEEAPRGIAI